MYQTADVTNREQVQQVIDLAMTSFGRIDVLFNNAGIMPQGNLAELNYDSWQKMLNINIMGVLNGIGAVLPIMQKQQDGLIIATDSVAGHVIYRVLPCTTGQSLQFVQLWKACAKKNVNMAFAQPSSLREWSPRNCLKPSAMLN